MKWRQQQKGRKEEEVDGRRVDRVQFSRGFEVHRQKSSHFHFKNWRHTASPCVPSRLTPSRRGGDSGPSPRRWHGGTRSKRDYFRENNI